MDAASQAHVVYSVVSMHVPDLRTRYFFHALTRDPRDVRKWMHAARMVLGGLLRQVARIVEEKNAPPCWTKIRACQLHGIDVRTYTCTFQVGPRTALSPNVYHARLDVRDKKWTLTLQSVSFGNTFTDVFTVTESGKVRRWPWVGDTVIYLGFQEALTRFCTM